MTDEVPVPVGVRDSQERFNLGCSQENCPGGLLKF